MIRSVVFILCSCLILLVSCNNNTPSGTSNATVANAAKNPVKSSLDSLGTSMALKLVNNYYDLKNAMVAADTGKAVSTSRTLIVAANTFLATFKADSIHLSAFKPFIDTIIMESDAIAATDDKTCEKQRIFFEKISGSVYAIVKSSGISNAGIYREYCPMAFNEKGAYWLSAETDIKNPYFGKKMLECGEVTDTL